MPATVATPSTENVSSDLELLRLARLAGEVDAEGLSSILSASHRWLQGDFTELVATDTAFLVEALFKCGRISEAAAVAKKRAALSHGPTSFDEFAAQYQRLGSYDFSLPSRSANPPMFNEPPPTLPRVLSLYHSSSTFQSSGYTVRTQAILSNSRLDVVALTRIGYPWAAKLAKATLSKVDKNKFESTSGKIKYSHRRGQVSNQSMVFSNIALSKHEIVKAIFDSRPHVVHAASNFVNALPALLAARSCGLPFVYEMRGLWELTAGVGVPGWLESERYLLERRVETFVAVNADCVIVLSEVQKRELLERGVEADRIQVVINGHEPQAVSPEKKATLLAECCPDLTEWIAGRTVIGYAGAIAVYEGLQDLVAAFGQRREAWRDVAVVIAGDGPYFQQLRAQVAALGLEDCVKLLGRVPGEVADGLYSLVDLCVLPRRPDLVSQLITPLKTVEILSHGKVLLASDVGAIAEQLRRYGYGETFAAGDRQDLSLQLERIILDLPRLKQHYIGAMDRIADGFSWANIATQWDGVLHGVAVAAAHSPQVSTSARNAVAPLYDEQPERFLEPLLLWRRIARVSLVASHERGLYLRYPATFDGALRVIAVPEEAEVGRDVLLGPVRKEAMVSFRELRSLASGKQNLFLYVERQRLGNLSLDSFRLVHAPNSRRPHELQELKPQLKKENRDTLAFEVAHDAKSPTQLNIFSEHYGPTRVALSYIPLPGAEVHANFVQRTRSKVTGTRFHYVLVNEGLSELALFPRASGPLMIEMTPWGEGEIIENRLRQVAKVKYVPRDGSYYPVLDRSRVNVLIAANINETLLDGSTIWLKTLAHTLANASGVNVFVATNAIHVSNGVTADLFSRPNVAKIDLLSSGVDRIHDIAGQIRTIDRTSGGFDLIIVRGIDFARTIVDKSLRDRCVYYGAGMFGRAEDGTLVTDELALTVASKCSGVIFQNNVMEKLFRQRRSNFRGDCYCIVPCVDESALAASSQVGLPQGEPGEKLVVYAGKLIREYGLLELLNAVGQRIAAGGSTRLVILGNKFNGRDPGYQEQFEAALKPLGDSVTWLPAVPPSTVLAWVSRADAVWGWRHGHFENSHFEVSTKMVEAITCGAPIVLYPAGANMELMGRDYEGFAEEPSDAVHALERLLNSGRAGFAPLAARLDGRFRAKNVYAPLLERVAMLGRRGKDGSTAARPRQSILVAGHDFRFFEDIEACLMREGHAVTREYWRNHTTRFVYGQRHAVNTADIIFCEWCLGNAVWWSNNLPPNKRLIIRLHLQEIHTPHPANVDFSRVERVIFISPYVMRQAIAKFEIPAEKCQVIPITVRLDPGQRLTTEELQLRRNTLGMVGLTPWRKRPDKALELLHALRERYPSMTLHLKGHTPSEYNWMSNRKEELSLYQRFFREVAALERNGLVHLSGYDDELEAFYRSVGWVLSLSDFEGCHTAVAEGGAMGCLPLMTNWGGADEVYPASLVQPGLTEVLQYFERHYEGFEQHSQALQTQFQRTFGIDAVFETWRALLQQAPRRAAQPSAYAAPAP